MATEDFTPKPGNEFTPVSKRKIINQLPVPIQSELLKRFFGVTVDQWFQPKSIADVSGYIGERAGIYYKPNSDFYITEPSKDRNDYQLEPTAVSTNLSDEVGFVHFYQDAVNYLRSNGALTNNQSRLFDQEYYSWAPPINIDMFVNFSNYYWLLPGPEPIEITQATNAVLDIIGKETYTSPAPQNIQFLSGMKIRFTADANAEFNNKSFVVEGVGTSIQLIDDTEFEGYGLYDVLPYDTTPYDDVGGTVNPQYVTIARGSQDINSWSRTNRWFHRDRIQNINLENFSILQARRPVIEFERNLQLKNFGRFGRRPADILIDGYGLLDIAGQPNFIVDGIELFDGARVLFTNDPDPAKNNRVYEVFGIDQLGQIGFILETDGADVSGAPVDGETIRIKSGDTYRNSYLYYTNQTWTVGQSHITQFQKPIFELFDSDGIVLSDSGVYPGSTYAGSQLFGFQEQPGKPIDPLVGVPFVFDDFGNIQFENYLSTQRFSYTFNFVSTEVPGYYFYKKFTNVDPANDLYLNDWHKSEYPSRQFILDRFILRQRLTDLGLFEFPREFKLSVDPDPVVPNSGFVPYQVFLNGLILVEGIDYNIIGDVLEISLSLELQDGDVLEARIFASNIPQDDTINGYFEIPANLQNNPNNEEVYTRSFNEVYEHFVSIIQNQVGIQGKPFGINNYVSTPRDLSKGAGILNHTAPLLKLMLHTGQDNLDFLLALRFTEREYARFKRKFITKIQKFYTQSYNSSVPLSTWVSDALKEINLGKTDTFAFAYSNMTAANNYIPSTPASLGILPCYAPQKFLDNTRSTPTWVIRGHDGSLTDAFGNILDDVILELENQIYNSIIPDYRQENRTVEFNYLTIKPGYFRETQYSREEWLRVSKASFERWAVDNRVDYPVNNTYDLGNRFSWNYSSVKAPNGEFLPGSWRGIYDYFYDTDRPHTSPWEMLGFKQKPTWWDSEYGPAPYTGDNTVMWADIASGTIKHGQRQGTYAHLARPGLLELIPVGSSGELLDPIQAGIVTQLPPENYARGNWKFGDIGPGEYTWMTSENYSYGLTEALFLAKPARFIELLWESNLLKRVHGQLVYSDTLKRKQSNEFSVHNEILDTGTRYNSKGISQWPSFELAQLGLDIKVNYGDLIRNLNSRLGYKAGGFTKEASLRLVNDSFGIVPQENIQVKLYKSTSIKEPVYSGVIITWDGNQYRVSGYDSLLQKFLTYPGSRRGPSTSIKVGSVTIERYNTSVGTIREIPYNHGFGKVEDVYNFLVEYQRYLESEGWLFDRFNTDAGYAVDFDTSARQFLQWSQSILDVGDTLIISPLADKAEIKNEHGHVDNIQTFVNGVYSILDKAGFGLSTKSFDVSRIDDKFSAAINSDVADGIHALRLNVVEFEHVVLIDNRTKFNDLIYDTVLGLRQPRFRVFMQKTLQWNGKPESLGFLIQENTIIPNFETTTDDMRLYFETELAQSSTGVLNDLARHVIGYQQRDYLNNLLLDQKVQFDYYRGMIRAKGTIGSFENIQRSDFVTQTADFDIQEEWAFLVGTYGNTERKDSFEIQLLQTELKTNPQVVEFITGPTDSQDDNKISITPNDSRWVLKPRNTAGVNLFQFRTHQNPLRRDLPNAGYVLVKETTYSVVYDSEINDLYNVTEGNLLANQTIWNIIKPNGDWTVYKLALSGKVSEIEKGVAIGDPVIVHTEAAHNLVAGDRLFILGSTETSPDYENYQDVLDVPTATTFRINFPANTEKTFSVGEGPDILVLRPVRFATVADRDSAALPNGWQTGDIAWVDDNGAGIWTVYSYNGSSWDAVRTQQPKIDIDQIFNALVYDKSINQTQIQMFLYDPFKGLIPQLADREIYYKLPFDPAKYTSGDSEVYQIDPELAWGKEQQGRLWWDLRTVRFLDYEQGDTDYRLNNWGKLAPGTVVDVYEWTRSPTPPTNWDSYVSGFSNSFAVKPSGTVANGDETPYVSVSEFNADKGVSETVYYFWVKNPLYVPTTNESRRISATAVRQLIENPKTQNVVWFAPISQSSFLVSGIEDIVDDLNSVLQVNFFKLADQSNVHKQWKLITESDEVTPPDSRLWNKMRDSLVGYDDLGLSVPDISLAEVVRYGNMIRPRQTWFVDMYQSRYEFFAKANKILLLKNVVDEDPNWDDHLYDSEPQPDSSQYDYVVFDRTDRDNLIGSIVPGKKVLVESDQVFDGRWSLWQFAGGTTFTLVDKQLYRVQDFWEQIDWYADGYDSSIRVSQTFATIPDRNTGTFYVGEIVKVEDNGAGRWAIYLYPEDNSMPVFTPIAQQLGTLRFKDSLSLFDTTNSESVQETSIVTKKLIEALQVDLLTTLEQGNIFFTMIHRVHDEQLVVDWAFKTSYVYGVGNVDVLEQDYIFVKNQSNNLLSYFNEVKPYHAKIRGLIELKQVPMELAIVDMEDSHQIHVEVLFDRVSCETTIPDGANPNNYDWDTLNASDRIKLLYSPTEGMPEKVLKQLISRCEFGGTIMDGKNFYQFGTVLGAGYDNSPYDYPMGYDFDASDLESFYDIFVNGGQPLGTPGVPGTTFDPAPTGTSDIIIEGNKFIQPYLDEDHPEELVKVRSGDAVVIDVYTTSPGGQDGLGYDAEDYDSLPYDFDSSDVLIPFGGSPKVRAKRFRGTVSGTTGPFSIGHIPQNRQALFVYLNGDLLKETTDYTINWNTLTVTLSAAIFLSDDLKIVSFGPGGVKIKKKKTYKNTSNTVFDLNEPFGDPDQVFVMVDGDIATFTTSGTQITITSPIPSSSTVFIVIFDNEKYSVVLTQEEVATGGPNTFTINVPGASTVPSYNTTIVHKNGLRLSPPYMKIYTMESTSDFFHLGKPATALSEIRVWNDAQEWTPGTEFRAFFVTGVGISNPGSGYVVSDPVNIAGAGSGATAEVAAVDGTGGITQIVVTDPGHGYTGVTTATAGGAGIGATLVPQVVDDEIGLLGSPIIGSQLLVMLLQDHDYEISGVDNDQLDVFSTNVNDSIQITTFTEDVSFGMKTEVFYGNAQTFYALGDTPFDTNSIWLTVNGEKQIHHKDYKLGDHEHGFDNEYEGYGTLYDSGLQYGIRFKNHAHSDSDKIVVTYFTEVPNEDPIAFKLYKNIFGNWQHLRISDQNSTVLAQPLNSGDNLIVVEDATVLAQPDVSKQEPGVVFIEGERIIYWEVDTTNPGAHELRRCLRGTGGTGINPDLLQGTVVRDGSKDQLIPGGYYWKYTQFGLQHDNSELAKFLIESPGSYNYP